MQPQTYIQLLEILTCMGVYNARVYNFKDNPKDLGFPSRRGLTPRGSLECNPEIPAFPGEE